jgi:hypothetical protein
MVSEKTVRVVREFRVAELTERWEIEATETAIVAIVRALVIDDPEPDKVVARLDEMNAKIADDSAWPEENRGASAMESSGNALGRIADAAETFLEMLEVIAGFIREGGGTGGVPKP